MKVKEIHNKDIKIVYNIEGSSNPIIFLHGNGEDSTYFSEIAKLLATKNYMVITPDSRGHGASDNVDRLSYDDMVDDLYEIIKQEGLLKGRNKPILFGFSDGGITGLIFAIKYPNVLDKLIVAGINLTPKGIKLKYRILMSLAYLFKRDDKLRLMLQQPNIKDEDIKKINVPTYIFYGQKDIVRLRDSQKLIDSVKDSRLFYLKNETHDSYVKDNNHLYELILPIIEEGNIL